MELTESGTEDLDKTVIEVDNKIKKRGGQRGTPNRSRSGSVTSRDSSESRSGNEGRNEGNNRITAWLKKAKPEEEK